MDIQELTTGEVATVERISGQSIASLGIPDAPRGLLLASIAFVIMKREDPKYTLEKAKELKMSEIMDMLSDEDSDEKKE